MARRKNPRSINPYLIVGSVAGVIILVMGFLLLQKNKASFGAKITETTKAATTVATTAGESAAATSPVDDSLTDAVGVETDGPERDEATTPAVPLPTEAPPPAVETPASTTAAPPEASPTPLPEVTGPLPVSLPLHFGRIDPYYEDLIVESATLDRFQGNYSGTLTVAQVNLNELTLPDSVRDRIGQISDLEGQYLPVDGRLVDDVLQLVKEDGPLSVHGVIRQVPLTLSGGEALLAPADPYVPGASAEIRVYFLVENMLSYVYSEKITVDTDVLAWLEVRVELARTD